MAECYVVVGPPRTGTSLTMGVVAKLGVWIGGENNMRSGPSNPNYYEHEAVKAFMHQKIKAEELVQTIYKEPKWGMKHPRFLRNWHKLEPLVDDPRFILTHRRDLAAQIKSHRRAIRRQTDEKIMERNDYYYEQAAKLRKKYPMIDVWFEDFFDKDKCYEQVSRIADFCGMPITQEALDIANPKHSRFYNAKKS